MDDDTILESHIITVADAVEAIRFGPPLPQRQGHFSSCSRNQTSVWHQIRRGCRLIVEQGFDIGNNAYTSADFAEQSFMKVKEALDRSRIAGTFSDGDQRAMFDCFVETLQLYSPASVASGSVLAG